MILCIAWDLHPNFEGSYYLDYNEIMQSWNDKYTFCTASLPLYFLKQPVPDYLRWFSSGELHCLPFEKRVQLGEGSWENVAALFMPTDILQLVYDTICGRVTNIPEETLTSVSFLAWLPVDETLALFSRLKHASEDDLRNEKLREQLQKTTLFKNSKEELAKICKELHLDCSGTKVELAQRLAKAKDIRLKKEVPYDGNLDSIPILSSQVGKLGKIDCCC